MLETRKRFHDELSALEREVAAESELAQRALEQAVEALLHKDEGLADQVISGDDQIDVRYLDVERRVIDLLAMQTPVASDLRLVSVIMHVNLHLERIGDMAVNIAKIAQATRDLPTDPTVLSHIEEMAEISRSMLRTATDAFMRRDLELCLTLPRLDDPVDSLNRGMYLEEVGLASDGEQAMERFRAERPALVILDLMLPKLSGLDVCRLIRSESTVPIVILTAKDSEADKVAGLELGADDYVTKPFSMRELVSRIRAQLRRAEMAGAARASTGGRRTGGAVEPESDQHEASRQGRVTSLPPKDAAL